MMNRFARILSFTIALLLGSAIASAQVAPVSHAPPIRPATPIHAHSGMVVAQESRAARIGIEILDRGGNAVDAAVAVGFALAVTYPRAGNLGGGGFMLIHLAKDNRDVAIDYRETAPARRPRPCSSMPRAIPIRQKSRDSALSIGVPGTVAGLALARRKYGSGKFTIAELIAPAIELARNGVTSTTMSPIRCRARRRASRAGRHRRAFSSIPTARCWSRANPVTIRPR